MGALAITRFIIGWHVAPVFASLSVPPKHLQHCVFGGAARTPPNGLAAGRVFQRSWACAIPHWIGKDGAQRRQHINGRSSHLGRVPDGVCPPLYIVSPFFHRRQPAGRVQPSAERHPQDEREIRCQVEQVESPSPQSLFCASSNWLVKWSAKAVPNSLHLTLATFVPGLIR
jgi:hypothetical protein